MEEFDVGFDIDNILAEFSASEQPQEPVQDVEPERNFVLPADGEKTQTFSSKSIREVPARPSEPEVRAADEKPGKRSLQEEPERRERTETEPKARKKPGRAAKAMISIAGILLSAACLAWSASSIQPASGSASSGSGKTTKVLGVAEKVDGYAQKMAMEASVAAVPEIEPTPEPVPVITHVIPEDWLVAPLPDENGFGKTATANAQEIMSVIEQARQSGLLGEDEKMIFDPTVEFNTGSYYEDIQYYIDDTLLVICWKEIIDGNTCTLCEVKMQDGSQLRRKLADDMFGSQTQEYTTTMHAATNAVVSMNADYYLFRDMGIVAYNRQLYRFNESEYLWRNGVQLQKYNCIDTLMVNGKGEFSFFHMYDTASPEEMQQYIDDNDIVFSLAFGPILVENGELNSSADFVEQWYPIGEVNSGYSRAGIGQVGDLHYLYMSLNHSDEKQARWTMSEFGQHFYEKGVINAYGLDGGQTSEIVFQGGTAYNHVDHVNGTNSRMVSDMIYFASALGGEEVVG